MRLYTHTHTHTCSYRISENEGRKEVAYDNKEKLYNETLSKIKFINREKLKYEDIQLEYKTINSNKKKRRIDIRNKDRPSQYFN